MAGTGANSGVLKRPATPPPIRTRQNVLSLPPGDPIITFYGRAIGEMKKKLIADPLSWRYQAAIHDYVRPTATFAQRRAEDPLAAPTDILPSASDQVRFWRQCQHFSWFFLPWHRMYIHHFEKIIMSHVAQLGGPADWALPYWNYSASAAAALLPAPFRNPVLADGSPNHLFVAQRDARANAGQAFVDPSGSDTDLRACLQEASFTAAGASPGFGGPRTVANHDSGAFGALEGTPHGAIHVAVSGPSAAGFMGNFTRAPLDPIFWLHHCNIDRLWDVWLQRDRVNHKNPTTADWLTSVSFPFHDASGNAVTMTPSQVLNSRTAPLSYEYDDTSDPLKITP